MKKLTQKILCAFLLFMAINFAPEVFAQPPVATRQILIDIAHGQKFWNDPSRMEGMDANLIERIRYMTSEITKTATSVDAGVGYIKEKIKANDLSGCDLLFIHIPSSKYSADEIEAIHQYVRKGGSLFVVMDANYWSTLDQVNANDIVSPYGIKFGNDSPDTLTGGYTKPGPITPKRLKITYHGARIVNGGTPFCFSNQSEQNPFGSYAQVSNGGKLVVMGDGMVSLYMTSWQNVNDYQCSEFMHDVFAWLLK